jgi:sulfide:quinone oxidoreductase
MEGRLRVVIAGGGVAALEAAFALDALAGERVDVELLSPAEIFTYRPLSVLAPFTGDRPPPQFNIPKLVARAGATWRRGRLRKIDPWARTATTRDTDERPYDALLLALGARTEPALPGALTFTDQDALPEFERVLNSVRADAMRRVAFVVPPGARWSLPAYELAFHTADLAAHHAPLTRVAVVTAEREPLEDFGEEASRDVRALLRARGIELATERMASSFEDGRLWLGAEGSVAVDTAVALPILRGVRIEGVPCDASGFVAVDAFGRVRGLEGVFAAGDVTQHPVKQGGLAAQQADAAASVIAAQAGADVRPEPFRPVLRGLLLTAGAPRWLRAEEGAGEVADEPPWWPPAKMAARYLGPALATA